MWLHVSDYTVIFGTLKDGSLLIDSFFFFNSLVLEAGGGEKAKRSGKNTVQIKGQDSKPKSLTSGQKPDTEQVQRPTGGRQ